ALREQGKLDAAAAAYREAIRRKPGLPEAHHNLALTLRTQGKLEAAAAAFREALRLRPEAGWHYNLGNVLAALEQLDGAASCFREAIRLDAGHAEAHCNLADVLRGQGRYAEALTLMRRGHELGSKKPGWKYPSAVWVRRAEEAAALERKL